MVSKSRRRSSVNTVIDSFITSVNRAGGEGSTWVVAVIFLIGGLFSAYMGFTDRYLPLQIGGPLAVLMGLMLSYKAFSNLVGSRRRK